MRRKPLVRAQIEDGRELQPTPATNRNHHRRSEAVTQERCQRVSVTARAFLGALQRPCKLSIDEHMTTQHQAAPYNVSYIVELKIAEDGHVKDTVLIVPGSTSRAVLETLSGHVEALGACLNEVADSRNTHYHASI